jgi:hypothetical protein
MRQVHSLTVTVAAAALVCASAGLAENDPGQESSPESDQESGEESGDDPAIDEAASLDPFLAPGRLVRSVDGKPIGRIVTIERAADLVVVLRNEGVVEFRQEHLAVVEDRLVALFTRAQIDADTKPVPEALRRQLAGFSTR